MKTVYLVYQDCPMCGAREHWGIEQMDLAHKEGIEIVKCPFYSDRAKNNHFCSRAVALGIKRMPFFTDGEKFGYNLADVLEEKAEPRKNVKKGARSAKKAQRDKERG